MKREGRIIHITLPQHRYIRAIELARRRGCSVQQWLCEVIDNAIADVRVTHDDASRFTARTSTEFEYEHGL